MKSEFALAFNEVLEDKQLPREVILSALESAMIAAYRKSVGASAAQNVKANIDLESGNVQVFVEKEVAESVLDPRTEVTLEEARKYDPEAQIGDLVMVESTPQILGALQPKLPVRLSNKKSTTLKEINSLSTSASRWVKSWVVWYRQ